MRASSNESMSDIAIGRTEACGRGKGHQQFRLSGSVLDLLVAWDLTARGKLPRVPSSEGIASTNARACCESFRTRAQRARFT